MWLVLLGLWACGFGLGGCAGRSGRGLGVFGAWGVAGWLLCPVPDTAAGLQRYYPDDICHSMVGLAVDSGGRPWFVTVSLAISLSRTDRTAVSGGSPMNSVNDISDSELLRRVVINCRARPPAARAHYRWVAVMEAFSLGSGYSMEL